MTKEEVIKNPSLLSTHIKGTVTRAQLFNAMNKPQGVYRVLMELYMRQNNGEKLEDMLDELAVVTKAELLEVAHELTALKIQADRSEASLTHELLHGGRVEMEPRYVYNEHGTKVIALNG
jgi:transcriptional antiterminator Rof (Rho-off)